MPLPQDKKRELDQQAEFHERLSRTLKHPKFGDAVAELNENPNSLRDAKADPKRYFKGKGADIPEEANWDVSVREGSICIRICFWSYCWQWCPF